MCARNVTEPTIQGVEFQSKSANIICNFVQVKKISHIDAKNTLKNSLFVSPNRAIHRRSHYLRIMI